jgi:hypothetical protein
MLCWRKWTKKERKTHNVGPNGLTEVTKKVSGCGPLAIGVQKLGG